MNSIGQIGEDIAVQYLTKKGYQILERNFTTVFGEIDIIAEKKNIICFVEVKSRKSSKYGLPEEAVTDRKMKKIIKVAQLYNKKKYYKNKIYRFDVISVKFDKGILEEIKYIEDAFSQ